MEQSTLIDKILAILAGCSLSSALGDNKILFSFFKALSKLVARALTLLTNTSLRLKHLLPFLKRVRTIMLRKLGKASYKTASSWRLIVLLKTIGKVIKKVMAKQIKEAAKARNLLPLSQMGARAECSTDTALKLLISMVRTIWHKKKGQVAMLLLLDILGAFNTVVYKWLIVIIKCLRFPS